MKSLLNFLSNGVTFIGHSAMEPVQRNTTQKAFSLKTLKNEST